jgi:hypothetical protein
MEYLIKIHKGPLAEVYGSGKRPYGLKNLTSSPEKTCRGQKTKTPEYTCTWRPPRHETQKSKRKQGKPIKVQGIRAKNSRKSTESIKVDTAKTLRIGNFFFGFFLFLGENSTKYRFVEYRFVREDGPYEQKTEEPSVLIVQGMSDQNMPERSIPWLSMFISRASSKEN